MEERDLVVYPGVLVSFRVPRNYDVELLDQVIDRITGDIEKSVERHMPSDCVVELLKMA